MGKPGTQADTSLLKVPQYCCEFKGCRKYFSKLSRLKYHQNTHLEEKPYKCDFEGCTSAYYRPNHLKRHQEASHGPKSNSASKEYRCPEDGCGAAFDSETSLYYHSKRKHISQPFQCPFCEKRFSKKWMFKEHEAGHTGANPFKCEETTCNEEFKDYITFKAHKRDHLKKKEGQQKVLVCDFEGCDKSFTRWSELVNHKKATHPKEIECHICHKKFTKNNLKVHLQVHQEDSERTALACPFDGCPKFYLHQKNLSHHIRVKHHDQGFLCSICNRKLSSKQKLEQHVKKIHEGEGKTGKSKKRVKKSTSILKKIATMSTTDWKVTKTGPPRYERRKYNCIKFPDTNSEDRNETVERDNDNDCMETEVSCSNSEAQNVST